MHWERVGLDHPITMKSSEGSLLVLLIQLVFDNRLKEQLILRVKKISLNWNVRLKAKDEHWFV